MSQSNANCATQSIVTTTNFLQSIASSQNFLDRVEQRIGLSIGCSAPVLTEISKYLLSLGGKRIRPLIVGLTAKLFKMNEPSAELIDVAAGIEMIHMATLLHDDIIDESPLRRHKESAFRRYGLSDTLLCGDFLLVRAFGLCAKLDDFVVSNTEKACVELTEGEVLEGKLDAALPQSLDSYLNVIEKKTASLFGLAACVGSHIAGANHIEVETLKRFGYLSGIAFQMIDDILDVTAGEDLLGKPAGTDLRQRTPTLVNILWLASGDPFAKTFFTSKGKVNEELATQALEALSQSTVISKAREMASNYAKKAILELSSLDSNRIHPETRNELVAIVEYTLARCN